MRNKVANYSFDGPFSVYCTSYIDYKKSLGFKMGGSIFYLIRGMDNYFKKYDIMPDALILTQEMVEDYISYRSPETIKTQHMRMSLIRQFALFMNRSFGMSFYVYPEADFVRVKNDFVPYILTHDEVERLIEVLDNIPEYRRYPNYHIIYPMLFRMLYGCGMRINEALGLKMVDIDFADGIIHLRDSKNGSERLLPMSESLRQYCLFYIERMHFSEQYDGYFYPSFYGGEYNSTPIYCQFRKFMKQAEIFRPDSTTPRVHDFSYPNLNKIQTFFKYD